MQRAGLQRLALIATLAAATAACGGGGPGGRLADRGATDATATPVAAGEVDLESIFRGDELEPSEADWLSGLETIPPDPSLPPAGSPIPAPTAGASNAISTTEASQLLDQVADLLRRLDAELAAFDDAAINQGE